MADADFILTEAGTGVPGYNGDDIPAPDAMVNKADGMVLDGAGNLYFADTGTTRCAVSMPPRE